MKKKNEVIKAIILAGGYSKRLRLKVPKQLIKINQRPLLAYTLDVFEDCKTIDNIILVTHRKYVSQCRNLVKRYRYKKIEQLCLGGKTRQESVFNALRIIKDCTYVIIHDGVRPLVSPKVILKLIKAVREFGAVTCAVKTMDTVVETKKGFIDSVLSRDRLMNVQTPQAFKFALILKAHQKARQAKIFNASDDTQLILRLKKKVKLIAGSYKNIKVTTMSDLRLVRVITSRSGRPTK